MKYFILILVSLLITAKVHSQTSDTLFLRNGMKIPCKVMVDGPVTIDYKMADKSKAKLKPNALDSIKFADGRVEK